MKKIIVAALLIAACAAYGQQPAPSDIDGAWMGTLDAGAIKLRVVFHVASTAAGLTATMDSLDQGANGIPVSAAKRTGSTVVFEVAVAGGKFEGKLGDDLSSIAGTWSQGGNSLPLTLTRVKDLFTIAPPRPQEPKKPYPYQEIEVSYPNVGANITLAATLTIPSGKGPFPAALLITGSGPQDRDEALMGHKPFLVLADFLTRKGIAVLRADDRGVGKSGGKFSGATTADFATDVEAGIAFLKSQGAIDPHRIGLIGHSEGGVIAPMVAARNRDVAFIVLMAGTGVTGEQLLPEQLRKIDESNGLPPGKVEQAVAQEREVLAMVKAEPDNAALEKRLREKLAGSIPDAQIGMQIRMLESPWFRYFLTYDPAADLRKVSCPVLAVNGSKDTQVPAQQNLPAIRAALVAGGNKNFETVELTGLNHLFQTAKTGAPAEYGQIEQTIAPAALEKIGSWIASHTIAAPTVAAGQ